MTENPNATLVDKINTLRRERHAVILAHNYQPGEIQDIADYVGDSLELSIKAASYDAEQLAAEAAAYETMRGDSDLASLGDIMDELNK